MAELLTTLAVWRPSRQWTILFKHEPYAPALWALLFDVNDTLLASDFYGEEWPRVSAAHVIADHIVGYSTTAGVARERLVTRLDPVRNLPQAWRAFSLTRALALSIAALPSDWPLRFDASAVTTKLGSRYIELMETAVTAATELATARPGTDADAIDTLLRMAHGLNPETVLLAPDDEGVPLYLPWPREGSAVREALLGTPVDCPTSHVETMTRARRQWEASWQPS